MRNALVVLSTLLLLTSFVNTHVNAGYLVVVDRGFSKIVSAEVLNNSIAISIDGKLLAINLTSNEVYELVVRFNVSYLTSVKSSLLSLGVLEDSTIIAIFKDLSNATLVTLEPQSTLYDVISVNESALSTGYVFVNGTYKLLLLNLSLHSISSYVAECRVACYGRKIINLGSDIFIIGSIYLRSDIHGWNYDIFFGRLLNGYLMGKYIEVGGNDYVVNVYDINGLLYVVINSDMGGIHVAVINPITYDVSLYRVSISSSRISCRSTAKLDKQLLLLANMLDTDDDYLIVINTTSLEINAYVVQGIKSMANVGDDLVAILTLGTDLRTSLRILNTSEFSILLRRYYEVQTYASAVRARVQDLNLTLRSYGIRYHVFSEGVGIRNLRVATISPSEITSNILSTPKESTYYKPLYEPRIVSRDGGGNLLLLVVGLVLVTTSIIFKYIVNVRGDRS